MNKMSKEERIDWFKLECKMKLIERASWRYFDSLYEYAYLPIQKCFPDYIDEEDNFYELSCFEPQHLVGNLDELEPIYEDIVDEFWEKRIFHELYEKNENLLEEDCYNLAETL